ncbi:hypothetical protein CH63R_06146 [Colletotrichum higginsianum IMI 349063]|uniref:Uncharacterized protein n=1 Tax=Colletotrichum higginsianum (strain IMI 349063) TaxID=759273 RepID=A0A1B7YEY5_COLHI|nr:hypothetical protein CH63R_06146 [Colletotrichum higginsianum IMI 349063]OBR10454.1 hypothetical protein CH63R_06146 [Colletotrichum higginsianum IMI 349063]
MLSSSSDRMKLRKEGDGNGHVVEARDWIVATHVVVNVYPDKSQELSTRELGPTIVALVGLCQLGVREKSAVATPSSSSWLNAPESAHEFRVLQPLLSGHRINNLLRLADTDPPKERQGFQFRVRDTIQALASLALQEQVGLLPEVLFYNGY